MFKEFYHSKASFINKLKYFIKPIGWKQDGTNILSFDLRKEWEEKKRQV